MVLELEFSGYYVRWLKLQWQRRSVAQRLRQPTNSKNYGSYLSHNTALCEGYSDTSCVGVPPSAMARLRYTSRTSLAAGLILHTAFRSGSCNLCHVHSNGLDPRVFTAVMCTTCYRGGITIDLYMSV